MRFAQSRSRYLKLVGAAVVTLVVASGCTTQMIDETVIASDAMQGRNNLTPGSAAAQDYLVYRLKSMAVGLDQAKTGDDAFKQSWAGGTNILAKIPGTDLANEYVIVGAHYDHLGSSCRTAVPADTICNGATDNGAGVAAMLGLAGMIKDHGAPRRTVILAAWDREEDDLGGSSGTSTTRSCRSPRPSPTSTSTSRVPTCCRASRTTALRSAPRPAARR